MIFVDSSVWVDYFNGTITPETNYLDDALTHQIILTGDLILTEVLQGFREQKDYDTAKRLLLKLPVRQMLDIDIAIKSADNYRELRRRGITIRKTIDCLIATFCIEHQFSLLHNDNDFEPFEFYLSLPVIHP